MHNLPLDPLIKLTIDFTLRLPFQTFFIFHFFLMLKVNITLYPLWSIQCVVRREKLSRNSILTFQRTAKKNKIP